MTHLDAGIATPRSPERTPVSVERRLPPSRPKGSDVVRSYLDVGHDDAEQTAHGVTDGKPVF